MKLSSQYMKLAHKDRTDLEFDITDIFLKDGAKNC